MSTSRAERSRKLYDRIMHYRRLDRDDLARQAFDEWNAFQVYQSAGYDSMSWRPRMAAWIKSRGGQRLDGLPPGGDLTVYVTSWVLWHDTDQSSGGFVWYFTLDEALDAWYGGMGETGDRDAYEGFTARVRLTTQVVPFECTATRQDVADYLDSAEANDDFLGSPALRVRLLAEEV